MSDCNDSWKGQDKRKHFGVCLVLAVIHPLLALIAAIAKEWYDHHQTGNHWCWKDIVADAAGILIGSSLHICLRLLF